MDVFSTAFREDSILDFEAVTLPEVKRPCFTRLRQICSIKIIFDNIVKDEAILVMPSS